MVLFVGCLCVAFGSVAASATADEPAESRKMWAYEGGWFAQDKGEMWYEMNEEIHRKGKPLLFREVKRTNEYIELYDADRKIGVRLYEDRLEFRPDADGKDAEWKLLYKGRWKKPLS
jgi:hypothetical protein